MITTQEAAAIYGVGDHTVLKWQREGYGPRPVRHVGNALLWDKAEIEEWARKRAEAQAVLGRKPSGGQGLQTARPAQHRVRRQASEEAGHEALCRDQGDA